MWPRPFFTAGEWAVYTALWSYPSDSVFPTHQDLADRAWVERGTASDAVALMEQLSLLEREPGWRDDESQSSNTYFLIEVPTETHLKQLDALRVERAAVQEAKRKKRKAANRKYEKPQVTAPEKAAAGGGYGEESTPVRATRGGTVRKVPPGYGEESTPGGTVCAVPGYGVGRTHESLGVTEVLKGTLTATPSLVADRTDGSASADRSNPEEQEKELSQGDDNQETAEFVKSDAHWPTLTDAETALLAEVFAVAPLWSSRTLRKVIGSKTIREVTQRDPELVKRAFLLGARDPETVPMRMWHMEKCPHWSAAAAQLAAERAPSASPARPERDDHRENRARVNAQVAAREADTDETGSGSVDVQEARAQIARTLAGKGYVPLTPATREIARQRTVPDPTRPAADQLTEASSGRA